MRRRILREDDAFDAVYDVNPLDPVDAEEVTWETEEELDLMVDELLLKVGCHE